MEKIIIVSYALFWLAQSCYTARRYMWTPQRRRAYIEEHVDQLMRLVSIAVVPVNLYRGLLLFIVMTMTITDCTGFALAFAYASSKLQVGVLLLMLALWCVTLERGLRVTAVLLGDLNDADGFRAKLLDRLAKADELPLVTRVAAVLTACWLLIAAVGA